MCRSIKPLFNFDPPATDEDVRAAAIQYVRKISGYTHPSRANEAAFNAAVEAITSASKNLLLSLETQSPPRDRATYTLRAKTRAIQRYSKAEEKRTL
ncbi:MAG: DUF2277 domain-containing protein [Anaerolineaceae bacterium]